MATNVIMPSLGFDMTEGKLARWLIKEGERIDKGQTLAEIETDKAVVEIDAPATGILQKIIVSEDQTVPVGTMIGIIGEKGESLPQVAAPAPPARPPMPPLSAERASLSRGHTEARIKPPLSPARWLKRRGSIWQRLKALGREAASWNAISKGR